jgi:hypothetical protein
LSVPATLSISASRETVETSGTEAGKGGEVNLTVQRHTTVTRVGYTDYLSNLSRVGWGLVSSARLSVNENIKKFRETILKTEQNLKDLRQNFCGSWKQLVHWPTK